MHIPILLSSFLLIFENYFMRFSKLFFNTANFEINEKEGKVCNILLSSYTLEDKYKFKDYIKKFSI